MADAEVSTLFDRVEDLAEAVRWLGRLVMFLCTLVVLQIAGKFVIYSRVVALLKRVEQLVTIAESHGAITDEKAHEIRKTTGRAAQAVIGVVKNAARELASDLPPKVAAEIKRDGPATAGTVPDGQ